MNKGGFVYVMANERPTLYTGVTNNLVRRVYQHKNKVGSWFTSIYTLSKLVYYEYCESIEQAIVREKQIKDMDRVDKLTMIRNFNPTFKDLYKQILNGRPPNQRTYQNDELN